MSHGDFYLVAPYDGQDGHGRILADGAAKSRTLKISSVALEIAGHKGITIAQVDVVYADDERTILGRGQLQSENRIALAQ